MTNDAYDPQTGEIEPVDQLAEGNLVAHADVALIQALNKSEIDIQITTAKTYPRSIRRFINSTTEMVTLSPQVAEECMYTLPRGGKAITGASVRFAEIIKGAWGNNRIAARVVGEDARFIRAQGLFHDLETNSAVTIEVSRRITDSKGKRYNDDMISVTGNAATSIAMRNAILRGIPKALWFPLYQRAIATAAGDVKTMPERRKTMFEQFKALGAEKVQLMRWLEVAGEEDIGVEQFMTLAGLLNTFKDGQVNVVEFFEKAARGEDAGGDDKPRPTVVFVTPIGDGSSPKSQLLPQGVGGYVIEGRSRVLDDGEVVHAADE